MSVKKKGKINNKINDLKAKAQHTPMCTFALVFSFLSMLRGRNLPFSQQTNLYW